MKKAIHPDTGVGWKLHHVADRLLSFPGIEPNYLVRIRTYWLLTLGAIGFVALLTVLVAVLRVPVLVQYGLVLLGGYLLIAATVAWARRPILWIGLVGQTFTLLVTFVAIVRLGGLMHSGGIVTTGIAAVLFSVFLQRPRWTIFLFALFCVLLAATAVFAPEMPEGIGISTFANILLYVINTLWISGFMVFFVVSFIRDRLRSEEEEARRLKALDAAKTQFYTNISHEFRTPLTIISGMAEQISAHPDQALEERLDMIRYNSRRILSLVNQMLDLSKLDAGKMMLRLRHGDVLPHLRLLVGSFRSYAESKNLTLDWKTEDSELYMDFDADKLTDIVSNLISNAVKFTPEGGLISVGAAPSDGHLLLSVRDNGPGIPKEQLPLIFDRFYRGSHGESTPGSGIGLALAQELARLMNGYIAVHSEVGSGSEFVLHFPITHRALPVEDLAEARSAVYPAERTENEELEALEKPLLLVVDDYPDILQLLRTTLADAYRVECAADGREGLEKALALTPDLIVSDVMMPVMDGMELCRTLKQNPATSHIPVVLLTARADADSKLEGLENQADAYISKPFLAMELLLTLRNLLAGRAAMRAWYLAVAGLEDKGEKTEREVVVSEKEQAFLVQARGFIMQRIDDADFHVDDLCRAMLMSPSQLHRKLTALTGMPANRFIRQIRLQEAAQLLRSTGLNVAEVAYDTGFRDPDYFGRAFRKMYGMAPTEYREAG